MCVLPGIFPDNVAPHLFSSSSPLPVNSLVHMASRKSGTRSTARGPTGRRKVAKPYNRPAEPPVTCEKRCPACNLPQMMAWSNHLRYCKAATFQLVVSEANAQHIYVPRELQAPGPVEEEYGEIDLGPLICNAIHPKTQRCNGSYANGHTLTKHLVKCKGISFEVCPSD